MEHRIFAWRAKARQNKSLENALSHRPLSSVTDHDPGTAGMSKSQQLQDSIVYLAAEAHFIDLHRSS